MERDTLAKHVHYYFVERDYSIVSAMYNKIGLSKSPFSSILHLLYWLSVISETNYEDAEINDLDSTLLYSLKASPFFTNSEDMYKHLLNLIFRILVLIEKSGNIKNSETFQQFIEGKISIKDKATDTSIKRILELYLKQKNDLPDYQSPSSLGNDIKEFVGKFTNMLPLPLEKYPNQPNYIFYQGFGYEPFDITKMKQLSNQTTTNSNNLNEQDHEEEEDPYNLPSPKDSSNTNKNTNKNTNLPNKNSNNNNNNNNNNSNDNKTKIKRERVEWNEQDSVKVIKGYLIYRDNVNKWKMISEEYFASKRDNFSVRSRYRVLTQKYKTIANMCAEFSIDRTLCESLRRQHNHDYSIRQVIYTDSDNEAYERVHPVDQPQSPPPPQDNDINQDNQNQDNQNNENNEGNGEEERGEDEIEEEIEEDITDLQSIKKKTKIN
ncbi:hypothetical protein DLAC_03383 [Tieghemostelium lacteum]|uniref:Myb-like domain-containing protein n=1 Tax=Tieghemostelium lacteum TaxID=361077 RepID=A0A152A2A1_TIELA|nr:hypothetical protein DLAC_03383 [Tieghemostelium lacteum]|eukprot:KYR00225.1 hypothetical protein DLAC_03383 [Tieghemostelium lacteum]